MKVDKEQIRNAVAEILFLDDPSAIRDDTGIFTDLAFNSIDYIDLVFELGRVSGRELKPESLWPFPKMMLDGRYFSQGAWTEPGLAALQALLGLTLPRETALKDLHPHFTLDFLERTLNQDPETA